MGDGGSTKVYWIHKKETTDIQYIRIDPYAICMFVYDPIATGNVVGRLKQPLLGFPRSAGSPGNRQAK